MPEAAGEQEELVRFREVPMQVPYYSLHTQGIERAIKEVTGQCP